MSTLMNRTFNLSREPRHRKMAALNDPLPKAPVKWVARHLSESDRFKEIVDENGEILMRVPLHTIKPLEKMCELHNAEVERLQATIDRMFSHAS
jgi:Lon protease-like protein